MPEPHVVTAPSLQSARKAFARSHICDAARDLFYRQGYAATTFEQIAHAAGTRRTTLYSHFADKAQILAAIGETYHAGLCELVEQLPGPVPSRAEIDRWIEKLVAYVVRERTPASLVIGLGIGQNTPAVVETVSQRFREALAARLPAFARAQLPDPRYAEMRARGRIILRELSLGCLEAARAEAGDSAEGWAVLAVVANLLERFVREQA